LGALCVLTAGRLVINGFLGTCLGTPSVVVERADGAGFTTRKITSVVVVRLGAG
jgi:hypothetical protein